MIGTTVSHYRIVEKIGEGGMGQIFLADDIELHRRVALKFLPREYASNADALSRFRREAQAAAALDHPNIITIYDVGEHEGRPYIVMAYVEGDTLSRTIARKDLTLDRALEIATRVCEALSSAHAASVVHRDIKPDNIVIGRDSQPKILDFGLAKLRGVNKLTRESSTVGTISYMSPEQARGEDVDHRSDIFSLGAVIYEMITGRPPFTGDHAAAVLYAIVNEQPQPLMRHNATVTGELERIVAKCLAKKREERYQNADDLLVDLRAVRDSHPAETTPTSRWRRLRVPLSVAFAVAVLVAAWYFVRSKGNAPSATDRKSIAVLPFQNMSADPENEYFSDGITDDIIAQLSKIADLRVVSRTSSMRYKNGDKSLRQIGAELGVATILEGSVRREEGKVRIVSQLIDARTDEHIWANTYDRDLKDIFEIQSDVAERIARTLEAKLTHEEAERIKVVPTENMTAYEYYLRGRDRYHRYQRDDNEEAIIFFKKALEQDPDYALAYAGLGDAYGQRAMRFGYDAVWADSSLKASGKAIAIAPNLAEGYKALALGYLYKGWLTKALDANVRSTRLDPNYLDAFGNVGWIYLMTGRPDEAVRWFLKVLSKEPDPALELMGIGVACMDVQEYEKARQWLRRGLDLWPEEEHANEALVGSYLLEGRLDEARARARALIDAKPDQWYPHSLAVWIELADGNITGARDMLEKCAKKQWADHDAQLFVDVYLGCTLKLLGEDERSAPLLERAAAYLQNEIARGDERDTPRERLAEIRAVEGNRDEALDWLRRTFEAGNLAYEGAEQNPFLASLRNDKRFQAMIADVRARVAEMRRHVVDELKSST